MHQCFTAQDLSLLRFQCLRAFLVAVEGTRLACGRTRGFSASKFCAGEEEEGEG